jgi:hypothetical protein
VLSKTKLILSTALIVAVFLSGCIASADIIVADHNGEASFDLSRGIVYDIDVIVQNVGDGEGTADVTVNLISQSSGAIRDVKTQTVNLKPGQSRQLKYTLDGDSDDDYSYEVEIN